MKTIKSLTIIIVLLITHSANSQILWSYHYGSDSTDNVGALITDNDNNIYSASYLTGDHLIYNQDTIPSSNGVNYAAIAKFNSTGNRVWVKKYGNANFSQNGIHYDKISNTIIIGGGFSGYIVLGSNTLYSANGGCFLSRTDTAGNPMWGKQFNAGMYLHTTDSLSNIYVVGSTKTAVSIGTFIIQPGVFIAKMDPNGNVLWAKKMFNVYGTGNGLWRVTPKGMKILNNEIYLTADTKGDTIMVDTTNYPLPYTNSAAIMKFTNDGKLIWMKTFGPSINGAVSSLAMDSYGNCYVPGALKGTIHFDADSISSQNATTYDGFLAKYDSSGHLQWLQQLHAIGNGAVLGDIKSDNDGNCNVLSLILGGTAFYGNFIYNSTGSVTQWDNCIARYNSSGICLGVEQIGITPSGAFGLIDQDNSNNVVAVGDYQNSITLGGTTYSTYGNNDIAIAKLAVITGLHGNERHANNQLIIYANPSAGKCNITVPDDFLNEKNLTLSIYANDGKLIQQKTLSMAGDKIKLNLEAEAKGVYNVSLSNGLKNYSGKIVFE
jgi:hypothetical protein